MTAPAPKSPGARLLAVTNGERFLTREVAEILGVSVSTIRKLNATRRDILGASDIGREGNRVIWLYTPEDVERLRAYFAGSVTNIGTGRRRVMPGRGRPALWSSEECRNRDRAYVRIGYHRRRATTLEAEGRADKAAEHHAQIDRIKADLDAELSQRVLERQFVKPLGVRATSPRQPLVLQERR